MFVRVQAYICVCMHAFICLYVKDKENARVQVIKIKLVYLNVRERKTESKRETECVREVECV